MGQCIATHCQALAVTGNGGRYLGVRMERPMLHYTDGCMPSVFRSAGMPTSELLTGDVGQDASWFETQGRCNGMMPEAESPVAMLTS